MSADSNQRLSLPESFTLAPATAEDVLAVSSGVLRKAVFVEDHYSMRDGALRPARGGLFCEDIFGALDGSLESDRRVDRFGRVPLAIPMNHPWFDVPVKELAVLPPGYRPFVRTPEGELRPHDLTTLYGRLIAINARLIRMIELGAPEHVVQGDKKELALDLARLFDNEGCGEDTLMQSGHPPKGLASKLGTKDEHELAALLLCLGIKAVKA